MKDKIIVTNRSKAKFICTLLGIEPIAKYNTTLQKVGIEFDYSDEVKEMSQLFYDAMDDKVEVSLDAKTFFTIAKKVDRAIYQCVH